MKQGIVVGLLCLVTHKMVCDAFAVLPHTTRSGNDISFFSQTQNDNASMLLAKKRRRRKNDSESSSSGDDLPDFELNPSGELPDFDLDEDDEPVKTKPKVDMSKINPEAITANMMGGGKEARSLDELISDRSLESKFEFEEPEDPSIPDFVQLAQSSGGAIPEPSSGGVSKKAARKAAAIAAKEEEKENPLANLPVNVLDEKGNVSFIKIFETGAWAGIWLLVAWEVYLNSPFFDRAAPLAPVVYNLLP